MPLNDIRFFSAVAGGSHLSPHARLIASHSSAQDLQAHTQRWALDFSAINFSPCLWPSNGPHWHVRPSLMHYWSCMLTLDWPQPIHPVPKALRASLPQWKLSEPYCSGSSLRICLKLPNTVSHRRHRAVAGWTTRAPQLAVPDKPPRLCPRRHSEEASHMPTLDMPRSEPSGPSFFIASYAVGELDQDWLGVSARRPPPARPERRQASCACYDLWRAAACRTQRGSWYPTPCLEALKRLGSFRAADTGWGWFSNWALCLSAERRITPSARYKEISLGLVSHPLSLPPSFRLTTCLLLHWRMEKFGERRLASMD